MLRHGNLRIAAFIFIAVMAAYSGSLFYSFSWDDILLIRDNNFIKSPANLPKLISRDYLTSRSDIEFLGKNDIGSGETSYRPVRTLFSMLIYALGGSDPFIFHLFSIMLHAANAVLFFFLVLFLTNRKNISLAASLFFALHPIQGESVSCITFNTDLLAFFFMMSSLLFHIKASPFQNTGKNAWPRHGISWCLFLLACFSKEMAVTLPLFVVLFDYFFVCEKKIGSLLTRWKIYLGYVFCAVFYLWVRLFVFGAKNGDIGYPGGSLYTIAAVFARYILWLLMPIFVHPTLPDDAGLIVHSLANPVFWVSVAALAIVLAAGYFYGKKNSLVAFSYFWFFISLLPVSKLSMNFMAARYLYIPSAGFFILAACLSMKVAPKAVFSKIAVFSVTSLILFFSLFGFVNNASWRNDATLWARLTRDYPGNALAHSTFAYHLLNMGVVNEAIREYKEAIALDPTYAQDRVGLGNAYLRNNKMDEAAACFIKAIELDAKSDAAYIGLGQALAQKKQLDKAINSFEKAKEINPRSAEAWDALGVSYANLGNWPEAKKSFLKALEISPYYFPSKRNLELLERVEAKI